MLFDATLCAAALLFVYFHCVDLVLLRQSLQCSHRADRFCLIKGIYVYSLIILMNGKYIHDYVTILCVFQLNLWEITGRVTDIVLI